MTSHTRKNATTCVLNHDVTVINCQGENLGIKKVRQCLTTIKRNKFTCLVGDAISKVAQIKLQEENIAYVTLAQLIFISFHSSLPNLRLLHTQQEKAEYTARFGNLKKWPFVSRDDALISLIGAQADDVLLVYRNNYSNIAPHHYCRRVQ